MPGERVEVAGPDFTPDYTPDEVEFLLAMDAYKRRRDRPYPTWREVLAVARSLGYRKVEEAGPMPRPVEGRGPKHIGEPGGWANRESRERKTARALKGEGGPGSGARKRGQAADGTAAPAAHGGEG